METPFRAGSVRLLLACAVLGAGACATALPAPSGEPPATPRAPEPDAAGTAERLVISLAATDFGAVRERFSPTMRRALPLRKLAPLWAEVTAVEGPFLGIEETRVDTVVPHRVVTVGSRFERRRVDIRVAVLPDGRVDGLFFYPRDGRSGDAPAGEEESFEERGTVIGAGPWAVPGTLTLPRGAGPHPAVVLVHGSGPLDRDATIGPNRPFRDLARMLASRGIASLRYDKRTHAHAAAMRRMADSVTTREETEEDAALAVEALRREPGIDPGRVFVVGHSLGAALAPRIAREAGGVAGLVLLAPPARPLEELVLDQAAHLAGADGRVDAEEEAALAALRVQAARVSAPGLGAATPAGDLPLGLPAAYWLSLRGYDPVAAARALDLPLLVLHGGRDYQVAEADRERWREGLRGVPRARLRVYPELNHLFIPGEGPSTPGEYGVPGRVAPRVAEEIAGWLLALPRSP